MYNATVRRYDGERLVSVFTAQASNGVMLASNAVQCTGLEGTPAYDAYVRQNAFAGYRLEIAEDGCAGYKRHLTGK
jgi:hypothetical protein